jgi:hypothetical protein
MCPFARLRSSAVNGAIFAPAMMPFSFFYGARAVAALFSWPAAP